MSVLIRLPGQLRAWVLSGFDKGSLLSLPSMLLYVRKRPLARMACCCGLCVESAMVDILTTAASSPTTNQETALNLVKTPENPDNGPLPPWIPKSTKT